MADETSFRRGQRALGHWVKTGQQLVDFTAHAADLSTPEVERVQAALKQLTAAVAALQEVRL